MARINPSAPFPGSPLTPRLETVEDLRDWRTRSLHLDVKKQVLSWRGVLPGSALVLQEDLLKSQIDAAAIAERLVHETHPEELESLLHWMPFLLEEGDKFSTPLIEPDSVQYRMIRYHLAEIFASVLETVISGGGLETAVALRHTRILLLRQRYRFLAAIPDPEDHIYNYEHKLRILRESYATLLLERPDEVEVAFAQVEKGETRWSLDDELLLLLIDSRSQAVWTISTCTPVDMALTDRLLSKGLLGRDHLRGATHIISRILAQTSTSKLRRLVGNSLRFFHLWIICGTIISAGLFFAAQFITPVAFLTAAALVLALPFLVWMLSFWLLPSPALAIYPLALRVPGLSFLGIVAITGLTDAYTGFSLNAWDTPWIATLMCVLCIGFAFVYMFVEVVKRTKDNKTAFGRALYLLAYAGAASFWGSLLMAWLVDPLGLSACDPQLSGCISCGAMSGYLEISRSVFLFGQRTSVDFVFFFAAFALFLGVLTQLFWEDKTVAEPI